MKKVKYNGKEIYIDDSEVDINETGVLVRHNKEKIDNVIDREELDSDTIIDLWGENHE